MSSLVVESWTHMIKSDDHPWHRMRRELQDCLTHYARGRALPCVSWQCFDCLRCRESWLGLTGGICRKHGSWGSCASVENLNCYPRYDSHKEKYIEYKGRQSYIVSSHTNIEKKFLGLRVVLCPMAPLRIPAVCNGRVELTDTARTPFRSSTVKDGVGVHHHAQ